MDRRRFCQTGLNIVSWYHCVSSGFVISERASSAAYFGELDWVHGLLVRLTCHIPDVPDWWTSSIVRSFLATGRWVEVKVSVQLPSHSCPAEIRAPDWRCGGVWNVLAVCVRRGFSVSSTLWVAYIRLPSGSMNWGGFLLSDCCYRGCLPEYIFLLPWCWEFQSCLG